MRPVRAQLEPHPQAVFLEQLFCECAELLILVDAALRRAGLIYSGNSPEGVSRNKYRVLTLFDHLQRRSV